MDATLDMSLYRTPRLSEIEADLKAWEERIASWAKRIPWSGPEQREDAMVSARFLRKLVAECWIHTLAAKSRGNDPMDNAAFRARRVHRQIMTYAPALAEKMEARLPKTVPSLAA